MPRLKKATAEFQIVDPELKKLADEFRAAYIEARTKHESMRAGRYVEYKPPAKYDGCQAIRTSSGIQIEKARPSIWLEYAKFFKQNGIRPREYVPLIFDSILTEYLFEPNQLFSSELRKFWENYARKRDYAAAIELHIGDDAFLTQLGMVSKNIKKITKQDRVLALQTATSLDPLYRYCEARRLGKIGEKVADVYFERAVKQFLRNKDAYIRRWGHFIPYELRNIESAV